MILCLCFTLIIPTLCPLVITMNWLFFSSLSERLRKILLFSPPPPLWCTRSLSFQDRENILLPLSFPLCTQYFWGNHYWLPSVLTLGKIEGWKASCNLTQASLKTGILLSQGIRLSVVWKISCKAFSKIVIPKPCSKEEDWKQPSLRACYNWHALVQVQRDSRLPKSSILIIKHTIYYLNNKTHILRWKFKMLIGQAIHEDWMI